MPEKKSIQISLSEEEYALLSGDVIAGGYAGPHELIQSALWEWHVNHGLSGGEEEHLRALVAEGEASGEAEPFTFAELRTEAMAEMRSEARSKSA